MGRNRRAGQRAMLMNGNLPQDGEVCMWVGSISRRERDLGGTQKSLGVALDVNHSTEDVDAAWELLCYVFPYKELKLHHLGSEE